MYELIDTRTHGLESERPLLIVEPWGDTYRLIFSLRACDLPLAKCILKTVNERHEAA